MKIIFLIVSLLSFNAYSAPISKSWIKKIQKACESAPSLEKNSKINLTEACKCIANVHHKLAEREANKDEAESQLQWVLDFYLLTDSAKKEEHMNDDPVMADVDMQVAEECVK